MNKRSRSNKVSTEQTTRDVSIMLTQRLEREAKRIRIGLSKLGILYYFFYAYLDIITNNQKKKGMPNSSVNETNQNESAKVYIYISVYIYATIFIFFFFA